MSEDVESTVTIKLREIYDLVLDTAAKVNSLIAKNETQNQDVSDLKTRFRNIELKIAAYPTLATLISLGTLVWTIYQKG